MAYLYDTAKALAAYAEAAQLDPDDWEALWYLGHIQMRAGNLDRRKKLLRASSSRCVQHWMILTYIHLELFLVGGR